VDDSDTSEVRVTVLQVNLRPVADAGADLSYVEGSSVSLDGRGSYDPDGDAISYQWMSLDGIVLFNPTSVRPSFILPQVSVHTTYRFTLVVSDGTLNSVKDTVRITAINVNKKPVAYAGGDFSLNEKTEGALDGSLSYDPDSDPLTYQWTAPPEVTLSSSTIPNPTFTAPAVLRDTVLQFVLVVNDGFRDSDPDMVRVTIINLDSLSMETDIESVFLPGLDSFAIDTAKALVTLYLPYGADPRLLAPGFTLSRGASVNPASGTGHNFAMPIYYAVTAEDGVTMRMWKVEVFRPERDVQRALNSGWNWISLNVQPPDMNIGTLFSDLSLNDLDYLKSSEYSSVYYEATGWFGNLIAFPQNRMAKFKKSHAENLVIRGLEINPAITSIPLARGWNDIAYLLKSDGDINAVIIPASVPPGDVVLKGLSGSAVYYAGSGWTGELGILGVFHGYKIHVNTSGNLMYNASGIAKKSVSSAALSHKELLLEYGLQPEKFDYSATLIADALSPDGVNLTGPADLILACHGDAIRGVSRAGYVPSLDRHLFILTYFSNEEGQEITFRFKPASDETEYDSDLRLNFRADDITGEAYNPYRMVITGFTPVNREMTGNRLSVYPNPVSDQLIVSASLPLKEIWLYHISGQLVLVRFSEDKTVNIPMHKLDPGIYTLQVKTADEVFVRKLIKISH